MFFFFLALFEGKICANPVASQNIGFGQDENMSFTTPISAGLRVVRGPDWKWGDQDGGEGHAGTVVEIGGMSKRGDENNDSHRSSPYGTVIIQWDTGVRTNYRVGHQKAYDIRVLDSAPTSIIHPKIVCKTCFNDNTKLSTKSKRRDFSSTKSESSSACIVESRETDECNSASSSFFISGIRWSCSMCSTTSRNSYDLCTTCYMSDKHDVNHQFWRIETLNKTEVDLQDPSSPFQVSEGTVLMPTRNGSKKRLLKGLFPNCKVVRGQDWNWNDQDGGPGKIGKIIEIHGWDNESERSVASVRWSSSNAQNVYRLGHKGKVDLKVAPGHPAATYGSYYPDHLPILGKPNVIAVSAEREVSDANDALPIEEFNVGDMVRIDVNVERLRSLQEGHSGFNPRMSSIMGKIGRVHRVTGNGDVRVQYKVPPGASENPANYRWTINPLALKQLNNEEIREDNSTAIKMAVGRVVRVIEDEDLVCTLQPGHGEWIPSMKGVLGRLGKIIKIYSDGDIRVEMTENVGLEGKNTFTFNPVCLVIQPVDDNQQPRAELERMQVSTPLPKNNSCGSPFPALTEVQVDPIVADAARGNLDNLATQFTKTALDSKIDSNSIRACLQAASQHGQTEVVKFLLKMFPNEVDVKYQGKTALQVASHQGHLDVVR